MVDDHPYTRQVRLLVQALPYIAREEVFALKGGTAINLFLRPMPRLSVDIDLTFLPVADRAQSLADCRAALLSIARAMDATSPRLEVIPQMNRDDELRLQVVGGQTRVKIEVSPVLRGAIHPPVTSDIHPEVEQRFGFASMAILAPPDLYGGKLCAALDRQHPRDLFDVMLLMREGGLDRGVVDSFVVYLISHPRPIAELLDPQFRDLSAVFENQFRGMTFVDVCQQDLEQARTDLVAQVRRLLTSAQKQFLISMKSGEPNWSLLNLRGIEKLPAVQWKLRNIRSMSSQKRSEALQRLESVLARM